MTGLFQSEGDERRGATDAEQRVGEPVVAESQRAGLGLGLGLLQARHTWTRVHLGPVIHQARLDQPQ